MELLRTPQDLNLDNLEGTLSWTPQVGGRSSPDDTLRCWGGNWSVVSFSWHVFDMFLIFFVGFFCKLKPRDSQITPSELVVFGKIMCKFIMIWKTHRTKIQDSQGPSDIIPPTKPAAFPVLPGGIIFGNLGSFNLPGASISSDHYSAMVWNHGHFVRFSNSTGSLGFFVYWENGITDSKWSSLVLNTRWFGTRNASRHHHF